MKIIVKGSISTIDLNKNNFVASGGEGSIFVCRGVAYKIYTDPKKMIPYAKMQELTTIQNANVIAPKKIVLNSKNKPIGYTMKHISNTYALCQIFPKGFRDKYNLDNASVLELIRKMQSTIVDIHKNRILIVDLNEMNFLVDKKFKNIYFIDVDSYQTQNFPATAIMESIRDRHSSTFSELTDWFSFGIVSFLMFAGIHPFKGKHPTLHGLNDRMLANIPVFHKDVRYPKSCLSFNVIPQAYKNWYKAMFFEGKRLSPPTDLVEAIVVIQPVRTIIGNEQFDIKELFDYSHRVIEYISVDGVRVTKTRNSDIFIDHKKKMNTNCSWIAITPNQNHIVCCGIDIDQGSENEKLRSFDLTNNKELISDIAVEEIMDCGGRVFIKNKSTISEVDFVETPNNTQITCVIVAHVLEKATRMFYGGAIQNILGSFVVSLFPERRSHYQIKIDELKGYKIVEAKYENKVLMVIGSKKSKYDKLVFKFTDNYSSYTLRKVDNIAYVGINFTVLDNGVVVHINEQEEIEVFTNKSDSAKVKVVSSDVIDGSMKLYHDGTQVLFAKEDKMYRLRMK